MSRRITRISVERCSLPAALTLLILFSAPQAFAQRGPRFHTRSIVACDSATKECGIAVVSFPTGVPTVVPVGEPGVIVANQSLPSLPTSRAIIARIKAGEDAPSALANALASDPSADVRQFGVAALSPTAASGVTVATFTGESAIPEFCNVTGLTYAVQANLQTSSAVCGAMASAFESAVGSLPRRLLIALKAGTPVGTDLRGEFSASIRVFSDAWPLAQEGITEIIAEACVIRSANWQRELEFDLYAYLASLTPPNQADLVVLNRRRAEEVVSVLKDLGYYRGPVDAGWSPEVEAALLQFGENNLFFPKPTVVVGRVRFIDAPLAEYIVQGARRHVLVPNPEGEEGSANP